MLARTAAPAHLRRYCHIRALVRYPQHRTLPRPTETRLPDGAMARQKPGGAARSNGRSKQVDQTLGAHPMRSWVPVSERVPIATKVAPYMKSPSPIGEGESGPRCKDQLLAPARYRHLAGPAAIDIAGIVEADSFGRIGYRNKGRHLAVLGAADADAGLEARIAGLVRLIVRHVKHVVLVNGDVARPAELLPFSDELSVGIEDLDAAVATVGHEDPPLGIHRYAVQLVELALTLAVLAKSCDQIGRAH